MLFSNMLTLALFYIGFVAAHIGMVDDDWHRDVGLIYNKPGLQGDAMTIFEVKDVPECMPLGVSILSTAICKTDVKCTFYTGNDCTLGPDNFAVAIGCGDVFNVDTVQGNFFQHYICGPATDDREVNMTIQTVPHDSGEDEAMAMRN